MNLGIIINENFDADERDTATSGECGTFALALHRALSGAGIPSQLVLLVEVDDDGNAVLLPDMSDDQMSWRHCAVLCQGKFYDVEGLVQIEDLEANYPWGDEILSHVILDERDFVYQIACTHNDISDMCYRDWFPRLQSLLPQKMALAA